jgi:hypothetical protein
MSSQIYKQAQNNQEKAPITALINPQDILMY